MTRLLLVDDERALVRMVQHSLSAEGWEVRTAYDGLEALTQARACQPDLIITDIVMPGLDGLEVCRRLRRDPALATVPILFLTSRGAVEDRVTGLDEGADDYLAKPFDLKELKARVNALLRRARQTVAGHEASQPGDLLVAGALTLDLKTRQVRRENQTSQLTLAEFQLIHYLMLHPGRIFSSGELLLQVWGYSLEAADPGLVRWHVKNLRAKIEPDPAHPSYLCTVAHQGYIFERRTASPPLFSSGAPNAALTPDSRKANGRKRDRLLQ